MSKFDDKLHVLVPDPNRVELSSVATFRISPRPNCNVRETAVPHIGETVLLEVCWYMGEDDPYPGEYGLMPADDHAQSIFRDMDIVWIASGDVVPERDQ